MLILALMLFLKNKSGVKQHCLIPFIASNLGVEKFLKNMEHQKRMRNNRGLRHLCIVSIEVSRKFYFCKACMPFNCFLVMKWILKLYFLSFLDYWISLIRLTMVQIRWKDIDLGYCQSVYWGATFSLLGINFLQLSYTFFDCLRWAPFKGTQWQYQPIASRLLDWHFASCFVYLLKS